MVDQLQITDGFGGVHVAVQSQCERCNLGQPVGMGPRGEMVHAIYQNGKALPGVFAGCGNYDDECRHLAEPFGYYTFAFLPKKCRNGQRRWLCWVERHQDGTYTLGNRAF